MNRAYRVIFNHATGVWQCVSELARSQGKTKSFKALSLAVMMAMGGEAMAVEYTNSMTIINNPYVVTNDTIHGSDVVIEATDIVIGNINNGTMTVDNKSTTKGSTPPILNAVNITLGTQQNVTGTLALNNTEDGLADSVTVNAENLTVGQIGKGYVSLTQNTLIDIQDKLIVGDQQGAIGEVTLDNSQGTNSNTLMATGGIDIGNAGTGIVNVHGSSLHTYNNYDGTIRLGVQKTGNGKLVMDERIWQNSSDIETNKMIIGDAGVGEFQATGVVITDLRKFYMHSLDNTAKIGTIIIGNQKDSSGKLSIDSTTIKVFDQVVVGNEGNAILEIKNTGSIATGNIVRQNNATSSILINGGYIEATRAEPDFFKGFNKDNPIIIGKENNSTSPFSEGFWFENDIIEAEFDSLGNKISDQEIHNVTINPDVVITGNAGRVELNSRYGSSGFVKSGNATLQIHANSIQWQGDIFVEEGVLEIVGDYTLKPENRLGIAIDDTDVYDEATDDWVPADNIIDPKNDVYGKFVITGKADITDGEFFVSTQDIIKNTDKSAVWKDVVSAGTLVGQFKQVSDDSLLVDFVADYSDTNKVHLKLANENTTNNTNSTTNNTTNNTTGNTTTGNTTNSSTNVTTGNTTNGTTNNTTGNATNSTNSSTNVTTGNTTTGNTTNNTNSSTNVTTGNTTNGTNSSTNVTTNGTTNSTTNSTNVTTNGTTGNTTTGNTTNSTNNSTNVTTNGTTNSTTGNNTNSSTNGTTNSTTNSTNVTTGNTTNSTNNSTNVTTNGTTNNTTGNTTTGNTTNNTNSSTNVTTGNTTNSTNNSTNVTTNGTTNSTTNSTNVTTGNATNGTNSSTNVTTGNTTNSTNNSTNVTTNGTTNSTTGNTTNNTNNSTNVTTGNATNGTNSSTNVTTGNTTNGTNSSTNATTNGTTGNTTTGNTTNSTNNSTNVTTNSTTNNTNVTTNNIKFVTSVTNNDNHNSIALAQVLDTAVANKVNNVSHTSADTALVNSLLSEFTTTNGYDTDGAKMSQAVSSMQPLLTGSVNRALVHASLHAVDAIYDTRLDFEPIAQGSDTRQGTIWAKAIGADSSITGTKGALGYDQEDWGVVTGADTTLGNGKLGFALGYIDTQTDSTNATQTANAKTTEAIIYGNYNATDDTAAYAHIGVARSDIKGERTIAVSSNPVAKSDYSADTIMAGLGVSHMIGSQAKYIAPFARLDYSHVSADAYQETGAGVYNLSVDKQSYESIRPTIGIKLGASVSDKLAVSASIAGAYENGDNQSVINASFDGTSLGFATLETDVGRAIGLAGVGVDYHFSPSTKLGVQYQGQWRDNYDSHGGMIKLSWQF